MVDTPNYNEVDRRRVLQTIGAGAIGAAFSLGSIGSAAADESPDHYHNPTGPFGFGDVTAIRDDDGTYYVYGTETPEDIVPIARSEDLVNWTYVGSALNEHPDWRDDPDAGVWAPDINYFGGEYHLYYSYSTWGSQDNPGIGLATAASPEGPFEDQGPVFRAEDLPVTNCIDSDLVIYDGTPYMIWGSWYGIYGVELTEDGMDYVPETEFHLAGNLKEGAMIVEENGYYYLFYSTGYCCDGYDSTYEVEVGRSFSPFGPYYNQNGDDLRDLDDHHDGVSVVTGTDRFIGTGHNTAIQDDAGDWWMLYHAEATEEQAGRILLVDRIRWDEDDWPVVGDDGVPSTESPVPSIDDGETTDPDDEEQGSDDGEESDDKSTDDGEESDDKSTDDGEESDDGSTDDGEEPDDESTDDSGDDSKENISDTDDEIPGFGLVEPLLAVGGAGYLLERRRQQE